MIDRSPGMAWAAPAKNGSPWWRITDMIAGYCWPQSARAGERVEVFCSTSAARFDVEIDRFLERDAPVTR